MMAMVSLWCWKEDKFAPPDTPAAIDAFLGYWKPNWIAIMENELRPTLIMGASKCGLCSKTEPQSGIVD
ncbi:hypothetical protein CRYUN_Cryun10bG0095000 [Craigia yunnanensis]